MQTTKIYEVVFDTEETLVAVTLSKPDEAVMLTNSGRVIRYKLADHSGSHLFSTKSGMEYTDGGFDPNAPASIYTLDEIVVVVNDYKTHGIAHYPGKYHQLRLWREDYHARRSTYPITLYKNEDGIPHLIYSQAWNHVQIMNLDTRQILTAAKSLIEENAEEDHVAFYKQVSEDNKLAWPTPYDYFFGKLLLSPDQKHFLSIGWVWGSSICYKVYNIETFLASNRISDLTLGYWDHRRAACWIDNDTIAVLYDPYQESDEGATTDTPCEIHFHKLHSEDGEPEKKVRLDDRKMLNSTIYFDLANQRFVAIDKDHGLTIMTLDGQVVFRDQDLGTVEYHTQTGLFVKAEGKTISVYEVA